MKMPGELSGYATPGMLALLVVMNGADLFERPVDHGPELRVLRGEVTQLKQDVRGLTDKTSSRWTSEDQRRYSEVQRLRDQTQSDAIASTKQSVYELTTQVDTIREKLEKIEERIKG